jgi:G3E family GTPase
MSIFDRDKSAERLPVSLITGFLGSGKTTLLNRLLRNPGMADSAVIINEFGEIGIDHLLVQSVEGEVAVMASGCICCTVRSDLEETIRDLLAARDRGGIPPFRRILVESTGLADPAPIMQLLLHNPLLSHFVRLDAVVTTVDAVNFMRQLDEHEEAVKQVALADRLLLTKVDLAPQDTVVAARLRLAAINPAAPLEFVHYGEIDPERLFEAGPTDPAHRGESLSRWLSEGAYARHAHAHDGDHGHAHDERIRSFCLTFEEPLAWEIVNRNLAFLRRDRGGDLLRVKGVLNLIGEPGPVVVHGVHHIFHPPVALEGWPDDDRRSRLVFITRGIEREEVEANWGPAETR